MLPAPAKPPSTSLYAIVATLERIESGEANDSAEYRQNLMEQSNLILLVDIPGLAAGSMGSFIPVMPQLNQKPTGSSYVGIAAAADSNTIHAEIHVPIEQIRGVLPLVALFQMMNQQPGVRF